MGPGASMRWCVRIVALFVCAAVLGMAARRALADIDHANADQDSYILADLARPTSDHAGQEQARFLLFSTTDLWRQGGFTQGVANSKG